MPTETLHDLTSDLRRLGGGRVWSLMVSLFGDLAQGAGDHIEGPVLSEIMAALDVRPEAARVALHRLRNDGWITSTKSGRISLHALSEDGRAKSRAASPLIYDTTGQASEAWQLILMPPSSATDLKESDGFISISGNVYVAAATAKTPNDAASFAGTNAPTWLRDMIIPSPLRANYEQLANTLSALAQALPDPKEMSAIDIAVLRCLVVHNWRRLVLKHPALPTGLVDPESAYCQCQAKVRTLLSRFPRPALRDLLQD